MNEKLNWIGVLIALAIPSLRYLGPDSVNSNLSIGGQVAWWLYCVPPGRCQHRLVFQPKDSLSLTRRLTNCIDSEIATACYRKSWQQNSTIKYNLIINI